MKINSPDLWNSVWTEHQPDSVQIILAEERKTVRWRKIDRHIVKAFGSFTSLNVIEIGAGSGTYSALMASLGAHVTLLDYSENAINVAREFFMEADLPATFICDDALRMSSRRYGQYDVAMSFGLTEHFKGPKRFAINKAHFDLLRPGGAMICSVPNFWCAPYQLWKTVNQHRGRWTVGEEYPYTRHELFAIASALGAQTAEVFGDSFADSFHFLRFLEPRNIMRKLLSLQRSPVRSTPPLHRPSLLDDYLSYALVLWATKPVRY